MNRFYRQEFCPWCQVFQRMLQSNLSLPDLRVKWAILNSTPVQVGRAGVGKGQGVGGRYISCQRRFLISGPIDFMPMNKRVPVIRDQTPSRCTTKQWSHVTQYPEIVYQLGEDRGLWWHHQREQLKATSARAEEWHPRANCGITKSGIISQGAAKIRGEKRGSLGWKTGLIDYNICILLVWSKPRVKCM